MRLFARRPRPPAGKRPELAAHERVLAWAPVDGEVVVVTNLGLFRPGQHGRLGWHEIHKASWSGRELTVVPAAFVAARDGYDEYEDRPAESYPLVDPGDVPEQVRTRVTRSVAYSMHHRLPGGGVRVVARRVAGVDGLSWVARYDQGTPGDDETVAALVAAARAQT